MTGSSWGIGRVIADHLADLGANLAVHGTSPTSTRAFNEAESRDAVAQAITAAHGSVMLPVWGDLTDAVTVKQAAYNISKTKEEYYPSSQKWIHYGYSLQKDLDRLLIQL